MLWHLTHIKPFNGFTHSLFEKNMLLFVCLVIICEGLQRNGEDAGSPVVQLRL